MATDEPKQNLLGIRICITGKLDGAIRKEIERAISMYGGTMTKSVTYGTHYLVVGERPGQTKLNSAQRNGVQTISPDQLDNLITTGDIYTTTP